MNKTRIKKQNLSKALWHPFIQPKEISFVVYLYENVTSNQKLKQLHAIIIMIYNIVSLLQFQCIMYSSMIVQENFFIHDCQ